MNINLLTWNIWFDENNRDRRTLHILEESFINKPDFIAFQEVVRETAELIFKHKKDYHVIGYPLTQTYDTLILSKYPCIEWNRYSLPETQMGRNLLIAKFNVYDNISIATFHLESVFNFKKESENNIKIRQLQYINEITPNKCILMGDTNICENFDSSSIGLVDIFDKICQPEAFKNTYSGKSNTNIKRKNLNSRLDRIYLKNISNNINSFFLTGTTPNLFNNFTGKYCHPSDHYGVFSSLSITSL